MMGQYGGVEYTLAMCVLYNAVKHGCNHHDDVNRIQIFLKTRRHGISAFSFVIEHTIEALQSVLHR